MTRMKLTLARLTAVFIIAISLGIEAEGGCLNEFERLGLSTTTSQDIRHFLEKSQFLFSYDYPSPHEVVRKGKDLAEKLDLNNFTDLSNFITRLGWANKKDPNFGELKKLLISYLLPLTEDIVHQNEVVTLLSELTLSIDTAAIADDMKNSLGPLEELALKSADTNFLRLVYKTYLNLIGGKQAWFGRGGGGSNTESFLSETERTQLIWRLIKFSEKSNQTSFSLGLVYLVNEAPYLSFKEKNELIRASLIAISHTFREGQFDWSNVYYFSFRGRKYSLAETLNGHLNGKYHHLAVGEREAYILKNFPLN